MEQTTLKRNLPRDVFLHLFAMVALYWSAISFITLLFQYINYYLPDVLSYGYQGNLWSIRFAVSSLVIIFPLFILASWYLNKIYRREAAVRESKLRKWLIYLTLFIAALVIIGDLITVINTFLGGEITARFILKALSVLAVAAAIFGYYLDDVRKPHLPKYAKQYAMAVSVVVLVTVVGAFFIIGSPAKARLSQIDQQRVSDLQNIQWQIVNYWQRKEQLPENLTELEDPISGYSAPTDPETGTPYEYNLLDEDQLTFELCAVFSLSSKEPRAIISKEISARPSTQDLSAPVSQNWNYQQGRTCFLRTIDPELYPILDNKK